MVIRGVVSDAVPCLHTGVICDLPFNVVGLPKKMGGIIAHPSMICQSPRRLFLPTAAVGADHRAARPTGTTGILPVAEAVFVLDSAFVFSRVEHEERVDYSAAL